MSPISFQVDANTLEFESLLYEVMAASQVRMSSSASEVTVYVSVARGYDDIAADAIVSDAYMMPIGFSLVFCYVMIMLGRFHWVETRVGPK